MWHIFTALIFPYWCGLTKQGRTRETSITSMDEVSLLHVIGHLPEESVRQFEAVAGVG